jgi:predicted RNA-binding Zn ribbon-like protein
MTGRQPTTIKEPLPRRIAGNVALDLANTISWRGTPREVDHLRDFEVIVAWATDAGIVGDRFWAPPSERTALVENIRRLRTAIDSTFAAIARCAMPAKVSLHAIRDVAARSLKTASLTGAPIAFEFRDLDRITGPLAWAALDLLRSSELARLKQCPATDCRWLFLDRTKNSSRRWCDMATCGDRKKKLTRW